MSRPSAVQRRRDRGSRFLLWWYRATIGHGLSPAQRLFPAVRP